MARFEVGALDEYVRRLESLQKDKIQTVIKMSIYEGAAIVADEIAKEIDSLPESDDPFKGITKQQKKDLKDGFGISPMIKTSENTNVKIGFSGYGSKPTKKYPKGVPIPLTARSIISGTFFRMKNPFVMRAVKRVKEKSIEKMNEVINEKINEEMK